MCSFNPSQTRVSDPFGLHFKVVSRSYWQTDL